MFDVLQWNVIMFVSVRLGERLDLSVSSLSLFESDKTSKGNGKLKGLDLAHGCRMKCRWWHIFRISWSTQIKQQQQPSVFCRRLFLHHSCRFGVSRLETGRFHWGLILSCIRVVAIYTPPPHTHTHTHTLPSLTTHIAAAKPDYISKLHGAHSPPQNPMEAIKPFIFYVWASWLSYCWRRRDTGPTSKEPRWNYYVWIIHGTRGRYLLKGQSCLYCPPAVKLKAAWRNEGQSRGASVGCGKHDLISLHLVFKGIWLFCL